MDDNTKQKLAAAGRIGFGAFKIGSALMTVAGHGIIGAWARKTHHMPLAIRYAGQSMKSGNDHIRAGITDWKKAQN